MEQTQTQQTQRQQVQNFDFKSMTNPNATQVLLGTTTGLDTTTGLGTQMPLTGTPEVAGFLSNLNESFAPKQESYTKLTDIPQKVKFSINDFTKVNTKTGEKLVITISMSHLGTTAEYKSYLPDRFIKLTEPQLQILKNNPEIYFVYEGKNSAGHHQVKFTQ